MVSESFFETESHEVRNEDEWCEIQDLYDFLDDIRTDEITEKWIYQQSQIELMIEQPDSYL